MVKYISGNQADGEAMGSAKLELLVSCGKNKLSAADIDGVRRVLKGKQFTYVLTNDALTEKNTVADGYQLAESLRDLLCGAAPGLKKAAKVAIHSPTFKTIPDTCAVEIRLDDGKSVEAFSSTVKLEAPRKPDLTQRADFKRKMVKWSAEISGSDFYGDEDLKDVLRTQNPSLEADLSADGIPLRGDLEKQLKAESAKVLKDMAAKIGGVVKTAAGKINDVAEALEKSSSADGAQLKKHLDDLNKLVAKETGLLQRDMLLGLAAKAKGEMPPVEFKCSVLVRRPRFALRADLEVLSKPAVSEKNAKAFRQTYKALKALLKADEAANNACVGSLNTLLSAKPGKDSGSELKLVDQTAVACTTYAQHHYKLNEVFQAFETAMNGVGKDTKGSKPNPKSGKDKVDTHKTIEEAVKKLHGFILGEKKRLLNSGAAIARFQKLCKDLARGGKADTKAELVELTAFSREYCIDKDFKTYQTYGHALTKALEE